MSILVLIEILLYSPSTTALTLQSMSAASSLPSPLALLEQKVIFTPLTDHQVGIIRIRFTAIDVEDLGFGWQIYACSFLDHQHIFSDMRGFGS